MSENKTPLNDFLEMEENDSGMFADLPFAAPTTQPVVQNTQVQPVATPPQQTVYQAPAPAVPQGSLFDAAVAQTPIAVQTPTVQTPVAQAPANNPPAEVPVQQTIAEAVDPYSIERSCDLTPFSNKYSNAEAYFGIIDRWYDKLAGWEIISNPRVKLPSSSYAKKSPNLSFNSPATSSRLNLWSESTSSSKPMNNESRLDSSP